MANLKLDKRNIRRWMTYAMCLMMGIGQPTLTVAMGDTGHGRVLAQPSQPAKSSLSKVVLGFVLSSNPPFDPVRPAQIGHGDFITYTLAISNVGTLTATQVVITNAVPLGSTSVVSSWVPSPQHISPMVWQMATLAPGEMVTMQHVLRVNDNITVTAIVNTAIADSDEITPITRTTVHPFGITSAPQIAYYFPLLVNQ